jgi:hypothetical protein
MEGLFSFVLFESLFTSVSTACSGHPSLVSLLVSIFIYFPLKAFGLARITWKVKEKSNDKKWPVKKGLK